MLISRQAHLLLAHAVHHLKPLTEEIVVLKYPLSVFN